MQRTAKENLVVYPSFIVIDDVDSNLADEQRKIMEVASIISNSNSRVLLTTRMNNIYSSNSSILVPGLIGDDYANLVSSVCSQLGISEFNKKNIEKIQKSSEGSPLYIRSLF